VSRLFNQPGNNRGSHIAAANEGYLHFLLLLDSL
jgi:hypothetical protein